MIKIIALGIFAAAVAIGTIASSPIKFITVTKPAVDSFSIYMQKAAVIDSIQFLEIEGKPHLNQDFQDSLSLSRYYHQQALKQ